MSERDDEKVPLVATSSQTVGPFFHFGLTQRPNGRLVDRLPAGGEPIRLRIRVLDGDAEAVADAMVELWQDGVFGRMATGEDGACEFETIRPRTRGEHAGHINACLFARGLLRQLYTRIYFPGDGALDTDPALALVPPDRRHTLLAVPDDTGGWRFDIHLQGSHETVFFDL